jgi:hypothetical protein
MNGSLFFGVLVGTALIGFLLKGRLRLYYFACGIFMLGAFGAASGVMDGIRGNHWEVRGPKYGRSWYQNIGVGVILMVGAVYFARRDWPKKKEPIQLPETTRGK